MPVLRGRPLPRSYQNPRKITRGRAARKRLFGRRNDFIADLGFDRLHSCEQTARKASWVTHGVWFQEARSTMVLTGHPSLRTPYRILNVEGGNGVTHNIEFTNWNVGTTNSGWITFFWCYNPTSLKTAWAERTKSYCILQSHTD